MVVIASQNNSLTIVYSTVYSFIQAQIKETSELRVSGHWTGIHRWSVNSPHKWPVAGKMFPFHDVIMSSYPDGRLIAEFANDGDISLQMMHLEQCDYDN